MSILIFGMSPGSVYIVNRFVSDGYKVKHIHSHNYKYKREEVLNYVCQSIMTNDYDLVFPVIFRNQKWENLQRVIKLKKCHAILPSMQASNLESNKLYAKNFLNSLNIPTAKILTTPPSNALYVVKSDVDQDGLQTIITSEGNWDNHLIEEYLEGYEYSYHALLNKNGWKYLGSARDYKRVYDNDIGHNTIGMGSYSLKDRVDNIVHSYMDKIYNALKTLNIEYVGVMYLGVMVVDGVPHVLEINTRIGDPEIQSIGETVSNFSEMLLATGRNESIPDPIYKNVEAVTVKLMNVNYGSTYFREPVDLFGTNEVKLCKSEDVTLTYGTLHATGETTQIAANKIYSYLKDKDIGTYRYRNDIGLLQ